MAVHTFHLWALSLELALLGQLLPLGLGVTLRPGIWLDESFLSVKVVLSALVQILLAQVLCKTWSIGR